jgi:hypothetical protein
MNRIAVSLILAVLCGCDNKSDIRQWKAEEQDNQAARQAERVKILESRNEAIIESGRRAFRCGLPSTANPETYDRDRRLWLSGYMEECEAKRFSTIQRY